MSARKPAGTNRTVVYLNDENYIWVSAKCTPEGHAKPPFGSVTNFFNEMCNKVRELEAIAKSKGASL